MTKQTSGFVFFSPGFIHFGFRLGLLSRWLVGFTLSLAVLAFPVTAASYSDHPQAQQFILKMVADHGFERDQLQRWFAAAERKDSILEAIARPAEKTKPWKDYRNIFVTESRINGGTAFYQRHRDTLYRAAERFGVDPFMVVAIIGVETRYGSNKGSFRVIDALATLGFDYPPRADFFRRELEQFLLLTRDEGIDPLSVKGSYAGAMGYGQFIPSSFRNFAVDFDGDGQIDIWDNVDDAIGSVANYFSVHGWTAEAPVLVRARISPDYNRDWLNQGGRPDTSLAELAAAGFRPIDPMPAELKAKPLKVEGPVGAEFWLGFDNFYVITRYNRSHLYAMAAYQLSREIERALEP